MERNDLSSSEDNSEYFSCNDQVDTPSTSLAWTIDFTGCKRKTFPYKKKKKRKNVKDCVQTNSSNLYTVNVDTRKFLNIKRLYCISRPQYKRSCGASSVVSIWNYLFSTLGEGELQPISQEEAIQHFGFSPPFDEIPFGRTTGNNTLLRWFQLLCDIYSVRGKCYKMYKPSDLSTSRNNNPEEALDEIKKGLRSNSVAFIYHCFNHYFCPIGYEECSGYPQEAYTPISNLYPESKQFSTETETISPSEDLAPKTWIYVGDTSKKFPPIQCFEWTDILRDLMCRTPEYINIRKLHEGVQVFQKRVTQDSVEDTSILRRCTNVNASGNMTDLNADVIQQNTISRRFSFQAQPSRDFHNFQAKKFVDETTFNSQRRKTDFAYLEKHADTINTRSNIFTDSSTEKLGRLLFSTNSDSGCSVRKPVIHQLAPNEESSKSKFQPHGLSPPELRRRRSNTGRGRNLHCILLFKRID